VGRHVTVEWQASQLLLDTMCDALLPAAFTPSWQVAHPFVIPACEKFAGVQALVVWQLPQALSLAM
jgi:hypothetical protein